MKFLLACFLLLVTIPFICGVFYTKNGIKYFLSYPIRKNWFQAQRYCTIQGMHLLTIQSPEENDTVMEFIDEFNATSPHVHFWSSGTDMGHVNGDWYWLETGQPVSFSNWLEGAPSSEDRDCILLHGGVHKFKWYDQYCNQTHHFICQDWLTVPDTLQLQRCQSDL